MLSIFYLKYYFRDYPYLYNNNLFQMVVSSCIVLLTTLMIVTSFMMATNNLDLLRVLYVMNILIFTGIAYNTILYVDNIKLLGQEWQDNTKKGAKVILVFNVIYLIQLFRYMGAK